MLDRNDNRNLVLKSVADHPGATALDIVKGLGMNRSTIRYHLFILSINHKLTTHNEDDKIPAVLRQQREIFKGEALVAITDASGSG
ncbi:MAG TPA: ArsR family transcriptional regulator [Methanocella sp.]|nr:ArsR family transcriptional regulator [Methanocella sp.]